MRESVAEDIRITIGKTVTRKIHTDIIESVSYSAEDFGLKPVNNGRGIKMAVLDTGSPHHKDIKIDGDCVSLCPEENNAEDKTGHATIVSGLIKANNSKSGILGLAPSSTLLYGKVVDSRGNSSFNALVAGLLWCLVKDVDAIILALSTKYDYIVLHDAIKKARERGICVFAASGDELKDHGELEYPAAYPEVFSCGFLTRGAVKNDYIKEHVDFYLPNRSLLTTYTDNRYIKASGSSISAAFFAGLAAHLIEEYKSEKQPQPKIPQLVYDRLIKVLK